MSITRINRFEAKAGMVDEVHAFLLSIVPLVQSSRGCTSCHVLRNQENAAEMLIVEVWESVDAHRESLKNVPLEKIGVLKPMLAGPPSGAYYAM